ncbi:MAG: hypothetical protein GX033_09385 [Firmicutes bacterium]|nr:hypothetical protein [Bacillota bacterium]
MVALLNLDAVVGHCHLPEREQSTGVVDMGEQEQEIISLIRLGGTRIAARIDDIERILRTPEIVPAEDAPAYIKGKALRPDVDQTNPRPEDFFPVINMFQLLEQTEEGDGQRNLILPKNSPYPVGYYTGVVEEIREINKADIAPIPPLTSTLHNSFVQGVVKLAGELILLVDLQQVLHACEVVPA